jgi:hypothetical protein
LQGTASVAALSAARLALGPQPAIASSRDHEHGHDHDHDHGKADRPVSMAMHVHASFSEGTGSMETHLDQATRAGVDVLFWTEHDFRMAAHGHPSLIHFNGPTEKSPEDVVWTWAPVTEGTLSSSAVEWDATTASPKDAAQPGSVRLAARSAGSPEAAQRISGTAANTTHQTSLYDMSIEIDVLPTAVGPDNRLEIQLRTSYRPALDGRPAGQYTLTYVVDGSRRRSRTREGIEGTIRLPASAGRWTTLVINPAEDLEALWHGVNGNDAAMLGITVGAVSAKGGSTEGWFDRLQFVRRNRAGDGPLRAQTAMMAGYAHRFPAVRQYQGLEVSLVKPTHLNWFGPKLHMPSWPSNLPTPDPDPLAAVNAVKMIHAAGGLASYNHPYGTATPPDLPGAQQDAMRAAVATTMLADRGKGADILEVGYPSRGGVDLARHAELWDVLSRNGVFMTGTGVSDDHSGQDWLGQNSNFLTWADAKGRDIGDLLPPLAAGRVFFGDPAVFRGTVSLLVDGGAPMGSVTISKARTRNVRVLLDGIPAGGTVDIVQGVVDFAGTADPTPGTTVATRPAADWARGGVDIRIDTSVPRFVRVVVRDTTGAAIALSNPVWLLRDTPDGGIPAARRAR